MTPESQRIAIAEACGLTPHPNNDKRDLKDRFWSRQYGGGKGPIYSFFGCQDITWGWGWAAQLPDYLNDLNAMHAAESELNADQAEEFVSILDRIHPTTTLHYCENVRDLRYEVFGLVHTTAAQRAEAFLRARNLWQDETNETTLY